jgi:hypothetical protein
MPKIAGSILALMFLALTWPGTAFAAEFSCKCGNGTECTVSCGSGGAASCAHAKCSSSCAASTSDGKTSLVALTQSLFISSFLATDGRYRPEAALDDIQQLLRSRNVERRIVPQNDQQLAVLTRKSGDLEQTILLPNAFAENPDLMLSHSRELEFEIRSRLEVLARGLLRR